MKALALEIQDKYDKIASLENAICALRVELNTLENTFYCDVCARRFEMFNEHHKQVGACFDEMLPPIMLNNKKIEHVCGQCLRSRMTVEVKP